MNSQEFDEMVYEIKKRKIQRAVNRHLEELNKLDIEHSQKRKTLGLRTYLDNNSVLYSTS